MNTILRGKGKKYSTCLIAVLIFSVFGVSNESYADIFNPTTVEELISDIQTANTNGEDDIIIKIGDAH